MKTPDQCNGFSIFVAAYAVASLTIPPANQEMLADPQAYLRKICAEYGLTDENHIGIAAGLALVFANDLSTNAAAMAEQVALIVNLANAKPASETLQ